MLKDPKEILEKAVEQYGNALYWHIRRLVVGHDDAEDALQETFMKIYTKASSFSGEESSFRAWVYSIATREALQVLRRRKHIFQSLDSVGGELSEQMAAESPSNADRSAILLQKAILSLSTQQRIVFNLRYYDEFSYEQIAEITGKSEGTLRTNYHYATEKVEEYLKEHAI